ncbi:DUF4982 domain-containing protein [Pendulispora brunnea]|uniref:DUF4982 domain-containing protein n=1 Tax=Pendulispora brunnea TaxID=2905690 RepID=A0ABZ2K2F8_9BACT
MTIKPRFAAAKHALWICAFSTGFAPIGCAPTAPAGPAAPTGAPPELANRSTDFGTGWKFALVNASDVRDTTGAYQRAQEPDYDSRSWRNVDVPHDWSIELDPSAGPGTDSGTGFLQGGLGWYRKSFTLPRSLAGKKISVEFDGVYMEASVYVNGRLAASHPYGYTGFRVDLSPMVHTDGVTPNVLAVKVQNRLPSSRWYSGSGIYRRVHLVVTDPIHVARHGVFVTTPDLERNLASGFATVHVRTSAVNERGSNEPVSIVSTVEDAAGKAIASHRSEPAALGAEGRTDSVDLKLERPTLWSLEKPYLYTLRTQLVVGGKVVDTEVTRFGVRWATFSPTAGFSLNGVYTKLRGVNLHHDLGALGAAVHRDAIVRQMRIMKSMGVNALRTSHNPPSPEMLSVCEEMGIVMMVEAFDTWRTPKVDYDYGRFFDAHSDADIAEMVHAAKNSPAVVLWSIGNEIPDSNSNEIGVPIAKRLIADVKAIDTSRPVVIGSDKYHRVPEPGSGADHIALLLDGVGVNYDTAAAVDGLHARYPNTFFFESESSSETSTRGVYESPDELNTGENYTPGKRGTSSYDNNLARWTMSAEYGLKKDRDRKFFGGQFLWSGIDYIGEPTPYDVFPVKASFFGAVDTAGFPKDAYYIFKSQWTREPMVHIVPMNWTDHQPGERVQVWAYSNVDTVELFLNDESLGVRKFDRKTTLDGRPYLETTEPTGDDKMVTSGRYPGSYTSPNGSAGKLHLTWEVPFAPGKLTAVAKRDGAEVARDTVATAGPADAIALTSSEIGELSFITADVVDARGVTVPSADSRIAFRVQGGKLLGTDNGRQESAENYQSPQRRAFQGKALAIVRADAGAPCVVATATSPGLLSGATSVFSHCATPSPTRAPAEETAPPAVDASYSGAPTTLPAAMIDGDPNTAWSNAYYKEATPLLPSTRKARPQDWVALGWPAPRKVSALEARFTTDASHALPASVEITYWNGSRFVPVAHPRITWARQSNQATTITFDPIETTQLKLNMTSRHPGTDKGFLRLTELRSAP